MDYADYILQPEAQRLACSSLFVIRSGLDVVGAGFLVGGGFAVTADHVLDKHFGNQLPRGEGNNKQPFFVDVLLEGTGGHTREGRMEVLCRNEELDAAVLVSLEPGETRHDLWGESLQVALGIPEALAACCCFACLSQRETRPSRGLAGSSAFLQLDSRPTNILGRNVVLCAFQIGIEAELGKDFHRSMTVEQVSVEMISAAQHPTAQSLFPPHRLRELFPAWEGTGAILYTVQTRTLGTLGAPCSFETDSW